VFNLSLHNTFTSILTLFAIFFLQIVCGNFSSPLTRKLFSIYPIPSAQAMLLAPIISKHSHFWGIFKTQNPKFKN
jgi:hypothetical protein